MSQRTWEAGQSAQIELDDGVYPVVTQEDMVKALLDGAIILDRAGGSLFVTQHRIPTGKPHEFVTTQAIVLWQDRTNAKPQAEPDARQEGDVAPLDELPAETLQAQPENGPTEPVSEEGRLLTAEEAPQFDDGLSVDPEAVDESDLELRAATGG